MFEVKEILDIAIRLEKNGEAVYRDAVKNIGNSNLISLLKWMADEEVEHAGWFLDLKQRVETKAQNPFMEQISQELFNDLIGKQSFSLKEKDFSSVKNINDLIEIFIEFEQDTILFYEMLQPFIEDQETLDKLEKIIIEENNHIKRLKEFMEK